MPQYVASISYGKDSLAMLHVITDVLHWQLDRIITADVWATDTIPADLPPMVEFKGKADEIIKQRWGIEVEHFCAMKDGAKNNYERQFYTKVSDKRHAARLKEWNDNHKCHNENGMTDIYGFPLTRGAWCNDRLKVSALNEAKKTYEDLFYTVRQKGNREGEIIGFPMVGRSECNAVLKRSPLKKAQKNAIPYLGIAADEGQRTERHKAKVAAGLEKLPLVEANWTEAMCRTWCEKNNLLSPTYKNGTRDGCWFCHNQPLSCLRRLRHEYPDLWALLMKWDLDSPVTFKPNYRTVHDIDRRLQMEDEGYMMPGDKFRWDDIEEPQMNIFQFMEGEQHGRLN